MWSMTKIKRLAGPFFWDAMTTDGYRKEHPQCWGGHKKFRYLAWLGDALLHAMLTEHILSENGFDEDEERALGELDKRRVNFSSGVALGHVGKGLHLLKHVRCTLPERLVLERKQYRKTRKSGIRLYSERVEALIAAIYKHSGEEAMKEFIRENIIIPLTAEMPRKDVVDVISNQESSTVVTHGHKEEMEEQLSEVLDNPLPERVVVIGESVPQKVESPKTEWEKGLDALLGIKDVSPVPPKERTLRRLVNWDTVHFVMPRVPKTIREEISAIEHKTERGTTEWNTRLQRVMGILLHEGVLVSA